MIFTKSLSVRILGPVTAFFGRMALWIIAKYDLNSFTDAAWVALITAIIVGAFWAAKYGIYDHLEMVDIMVISALTLISVWSALFLIFSVLGVIPKKLLRRSRT